MPKAKRSDGHYPIDSLIQKLRTTGSRTFEADYLCKLSSSEAAWFPAFQPETHVTEDAEFVAGTNVHLAVDTGVFTGAVFFQVCQVGAQGNLSSDVVKVFADYLFVGRSAEANALALKQLAEVRCNKLIHHATTDPAGGSRNAIGPTVLFEYEKSGLTLTAWPLAKVADSLALLDSFLTPATGPPRLLIHPRCVDLINALQCYQRAKRAGQWLDKAQRPPASLRGSGRRAPGRPESALSRRAWSREVVPPHSGQKLVVSILR